MEKENYKNTSILIEKKRGHSLGIDMYLNHLSQTTENFFIVLC